MRTNRTQFAVMAVLRIGPATGYEIREFCRENLRHFWSESFGQIYPTLARLAEGGLIRRVDGGTRPGATRYALTDLGRERLRSWLAEPVEHRMVRDEVLLKLLCGTEAPPGTHLEHIASVRRQSREQLDKIKRAGRELEARMAGHPDFRHWLLMIRAGELVLEARLRWCDEAETSLSTDAPPQEKER